MKIQVCKKPNGKWLWCLKANNGETLAHSEFYSSKNAALDTVTMVVDAFNGDEQIDFVIKEKK